MRWHLYHVHKWKDVTDLMISPSPKQLAKLAIIREIELKGFADGLPMEVADLRQLVERHFGEQAGW